MRPLPLLRSALRIGTGLSLGALAAFAELTYLWFAGLLRLAALAWPQSRSRPQAQSRAQTQTRARARVTGVLDRGAVRLARWNSARVARYFSRDSPIEPGPHSRCWTYLLLRTPVGLAVGLILFLLAYGALTVAAMLGAWIKGSSIFTGNPAGYVNTTTVIVASPLALVLLYLAVHGLYGLSTVEQRLVRAFLGVSPAELRQRIQSLTETRAGIVAAVDAERRRIERDLHDGVQQRLVALGLLIGRARRGEDPQRTDPQHVDPQHVDPQRTQRLLAQAHQECQQALDDLREVAWRVYPTALDNLGLRAAVDRVVESSPLHTTVSVDLSGERPPAQVEAAAYFIISEAVTNATKHAGASTLELVLNQTPEHLVVMITDDGSGTANPHGTGLSGLARRVAAMDGYFEVDSEPGKGTMILAHLPLPTPEPAPHAPDPR